MPTAVEDLLDSVTTGVLRALDARRAGAVTNTSGFYVNVIIRCGIPPAVENVQIAGSSPEIGPTQGK